MEVDGQEKEEKEDLVVDKLIWKYKIEGVNKS